MVPKQPTDNVDTRDSEDAGSIGPKPYPLDQPPEADSEVLSLLHGLQSFKPTFSYLVAELDSPPHTIGADLQTHIDCNVVRFHDESPPRYSHRAAQRDDGERSVEDSVIGKK